MKCHREPMCMNVEMEDDKSGVQSWDRHDYLCQDDEWGRLMIGSTLDWTCPMSWCDYSDGPNPRLHLCIEHTPYTGFGMSECYQWRGRFLETGSVKIYPWSLRGQLPVVKKASGIPTVLPIDESSWSWQVFREAVGVDSVS
jgi:hypothetical protein